MERPFEQPQLLEETAAFFTYFSCECFDFVFPCTTWTPFTQHSYGEFCEQPPILKIGVRFPFDSRITPSGSPWKPELSKGLFFSNIHKQLYLFLLLFLETFLCWKRRASWRGNDRRWVGDCLFTTDVGFPSHHSSQNSTRCYVASGTIQKLIIIFINSQGEPWKKNVVTNSYS